MCKRLGQSFKEALYEIAKREEIAIYDYDGCDFKKLQALDEQKQHIIIVWDGQSDEIRQTPMGWALDFSTKMFDRKSKVTTYIYIVDLTGEEHDQESEMWIRKELLVEMPWVRIYAPLVPERIGEKARIRDGYIPIVGDSWSLLKEENDQLVLNLSRPETQPLQHKRLLR